MMDGMGWGGMWLGPIFWLIIFGAVIWGVTRIINSNPSRNSKIVAPLKEGALEILKKRYARGEITKEQFEQMKIDLIS
jgi:putative membrane protein